MLGGFPETHETDIDCSKRFLEMLFNNYQVKQNKTIDLGAGIGRVSKSLLSNYFNIVDLAEQNPAYVEEAKKQLSQLPSMRNFIVSNLQDYQFQDKYDVIWVQWVILYLPDQDLKAFLKRCQQSITETGIIVIKENVAKEGFYIDKQDNSIMRTIENYQQLIQEAGLTVLTIVDQDNWDGDLFPVKIIAIR